MEQVRIPLLRFTAAGNGAELASHYLVEPGIARKVHLYLVMRYDRVEGYTITQEQKVVAAEHWLVLNRIEELLAMGRFITEPVPFWNREAFMLANMICGLFETTVAVETDVEFEPLECV